MSTKIIEINLLPSEYKERMAPTSKKLGLDIPRFIPISLAALLSVLVLANMLVFLHASSSRKNLLGKQAELKKTKEMSAQARELDEDLPAMRKKDEFLTANVQSKLKFWRVLEQLIVCCPEMVRITDIRISGTSEINILTVEGNYKKGDNLEEQFRINLEHSDSLKKFYTKFRAERRIVPDSQTDFTIIGTSQ